MVSKEIISEVEQLNEEFQSFKDFIEEDVLNLFRDYQNKQLWICEKIREKDWDFYPQEHTFKNFIHFQRFRDIMGNKLIKHILINYQFGITNKFNEVSLIDWCNEALGYFVRDIFRILCFWIRVVLDLDEKIAIAKNQDEPYLEETEKKKKILEIYLLEEFRKIKLSDIF